MADRSRIELNPDLVEDLARQIGVVASAVEEEFAPLRNRALTGLAAIPESDLRQAYSYCWGRWSQALIDGFEQLQRAGDQARQAAATWRGAELDAARTFDSSSRHSQAEP